MEIENVAPKPETVVVFTFKFLGGTARIIDIWEERGDKYEIHEHEFTFEAPRANWEEIVFKRNLLSVEIEEQQRVYIDSQAMAKAEIERLKQEAKERAEERARSRKSR